MVGKRIYIPLIPASSQPDASPLLDDEDELDEDANLFMTVFIPDGVFGVKKFFFESFGKRDF